MKLISKEYLIMFLGYFGILFIVLGILITPSQDDLRDAELRTEHYAGGEFRITEDNEITEYGKALGDYNKLKRREVVAEHFVPIGLGMVILTIPFAIMRFSKRAIEAPQPPYPYPYPRVQKPEKFIVGIKEDHEERI